MASSGAGSPSPGGAVRPAPADRMPWTAVAAGVCGVVAVLPLTFVVWLVFALGGLAAGSAREPWLWLVVAAPLVQLAGAVWLLARRGRVPLVVACVLAAGLVGIIYWADRGETGSVGPGPLLLVVFPLAAAAFAVSGPTGRWLAGRPSEAARRHG